MQKVNGHRRLRVGVDIDDTVLDFHGPLLEYYATISGRRLLYEQFHSYSLAEIAGINENEAQLVYDGFKMTSHFHDLRPLPGVCEALQEISSFGADLFAITARQPQEEAPTLACMEKYLSTPISSYFFCKNANVSWADVPREKATIAKKLDLDCMIEDSAWNSVVIAEGGTRLFMPPRPWNINVKHRNIIRCDPKTMVQHLRKYIENHYRWDDPTEI